MLLEPIYTNLFRQALELFLKGFFAKESPSSDYATVFNRKLSAQWESFKSVTNDPELSDFDDVVIALEKFKEMQTATGILEAGMSISLQLEQTAAPREMKYLDLEKLDRLVLTILEKARVPASVYFEYLDSRLKDSLPNGFTSG